MDNSIQLTANDIEKFQRLYFKHFNTSLKTEEAREELLGLVHQLEVIYRPITTTQYDKLQYVDGNEDYERRRPTPN